MNLEMLKKGFAPILVLVLIIAVVGGLLFWVVRNQNVTPTQEQISRMENDRYLCFQDRDCDYTAPGARLDCNSQRANVYYLKKHPGEFTKMTLKGCNGTFHAVCQTSECDIISSSY